MKGQRGSILIGVLAMSLIMTLAAGGLIFVAANTGNDEQRSAEDLTLHYAAESAILLGLKWIRMHTPANMQSTVAETIVLTQPTTDYALIDGIKVRLVLKPHPLLALPNRSLEANAFYEGAKDTLVVKWTIADVVASDDDPVNRSRSILSRWEEYYLSGSP